MDQASHDDTDFTIDMPAAQVRPVPQVATPERGAVEKMAIKEAIRDTGVAALYITHDLAVVRRIADTVTVLGQAAQFCCASSLGED